MKIPGSPSQHSTPSRPPAPNDGPSGPSTSKAATPTEKASSDPLTSALVELAENGRRAPKGEAERIRGNLAAGFEALVSLHDDQNKETVISLRSESDLLLYSALTTGAPVDEAAQELHSELKKAQLDGHRFALERKGKDLTTDSAGATVALLRGSRVNLRRADGERASAKSPEQAAAFLQAPLDPTKTERVGRLDKAREAGLTLTPSLDEEKVDLTSRGMIVSLVKSVFGSDSALDQDLLKALESGGKIDVAFAKDDRPMAAPTTLTESGLDRALNWETTPSKEMEAFQERFAECSENEVLFMARQGAGPMKGMVLRADDRAAYLNLAEGETVIALDGKGDLHRLDSLDDFAAFAEHGKVPGREMPAFDGNATPSDNLFLMYHVSPFDPIEKGNYDDLPLRLTELGSDERVDIVAMRSDLPTKRNLRMDRIQQGALQELSRLDPEKAMSDPEVLENFLYQAIKENASDGKVRLMVGGHGGAEKGLLPDGEHNNAAADNAMPVDDFAGAIKKALDRVQEETGERPKIENLILVSCLMGNTSFLHALAQTGDVETLIASPELMMGNSPVSPFEYLRDPANSKASGHDYARYLVDEYSQAPASPGGNPSMKHASTMGAYDLNPKKAERFQEALNGFFEAALESPESARHIKEAIAKTPTYGMNPIMNLMFDVDNRDLYQVLDRVEGDARIGSKELKKAVAELKEAALDQVISQKVDKGYEGRKGPSLYLPIDRWDYSPKMGETELLKGTRFHDFMEMIFDAPVQRGAGATLLSEAERILQKANGALSAVVNEGGSDNSDQGKKVSGEEAIPPTPDGTLPEKKLMEKVLEKLEDRKEQAERLEELRGLEETTRARPLGRALGLAKGAVRTAFTVAGAAIGGVVGAVPAAVAGGVLGLRAGLTGTSAAGTAQPRTPDPAPAESEAKPEATSAPNKTDETRGSQAPPHEVSEGDDAGAATEAEPEEASDPTEALWDLLKDNLPTRALAQLVLWPAESAGLAAHSGLGYRFGSLAGRVGGALVGAAVGAVGAALAGGLAGAAAGGAGGYLLGGKVSGVLPGPKDERPTPSFQGRYEAPESSPSRSGE